MHPTEPYPAAPVLDASFNRTVRLLLNRDFQRVFGNKRSIAGKFMVIWNAQGEGAASRLGVIASKRTFRRAVDRNRAKRLLRESFRLERAPMADDADLVIVARARILAAGIVEVRREFARLMDALGLAHKPDHSR
ncbi:MAG TPA: ribonuclease P protein component [Verrucomicrobia bacterium]|nr:ribonuclease P protein component [Verrucomicrobiota bacterium]